ncbi:scavenger receptor cysteine-rich type 1 protein M130-like isoform X1 [Conger conger]|uniref:scavenger receptor cysteine-rich type 1 protein M130-like isoform X1 n=1 Tax=Conger conger TaxID=82655 RepID=UPI002A5B0C52|nr:scavenger receptor cysteine-rich type 1 protein M130-like isoform X1 [Conger conger]
MTDSRLRLRHVEKNVNVDGKRISGAFCSLLERNVTARLHTGKRVQLDAALERLLKKWFLSVMSKTLLKALLVFTLSSAFTLSDSDTAKVRLVGGGSCSGRVEVLHLGQWGTVCDDVWDLEHARLACRELGCGPAAAALKRAHFGQGNGAIWLLEAACRKDDQSLANCIYLPPGYINCKHGEDAGVECGPGSSGGLHSGSNSDDYKASTPGYPRWQVALLVMLALLLVVLGMSFVFYRRFKIRQLQSSRRECEDNIYIDMTVQ